METAHRPHIKSHVLAMHSGPHLVGLWLGGSLGPWVQDVVAPSARASHTASPAAQTTVATATVAPVTACNASCCVASSCDAIWGESLACLILISEHLTQASTWKYV